MKCLNSVIKNEYKPYKIMTHTEARTQKINRRAYSQMKTIIKLLKQEVTYDKQHHIKEYEDFDFADFKDPKIDGQAIANSINGNGMGYIIPATNLDVIYNQDDTLIFYQSQDPLTDSSLTSARVLNIIERLVKLGRHGIYLKIHKNNKLRKNLITNLKALQKKVSQTEHELDLTL